MHDATLSFSEWELVHPDGLVRVLFLPGSPAKFPNDMALFVLAPQDVLVRHESLKPDRTTRVDPPGADPHLSTKAIPEAVGEARARVDEYARRVDAADERARCVGGLGDDAVGVVRAVRVDV
jgi:hypothetical protein